MSKLAVELREKMNAGFNVEVRADPRQVTYQMAVDATEFATTASKLKLRAITQSWQVTDFDDNSWMCMFPKEVSEENKETMFIVLNPRINKLIFTLIEAKK
jgi:hypothetical protein